MNNSIRMYVGVMVLVLASALSAWAYPVEVNDKVYMYNDYNSSTSTPDGAYKGYYQADNSSDNAGKFGVFCLEKTEYFYLNTQYTVKSIDDRAFNGGNDLSEPTVTGDPISNATKWLFYHFLKQDILAATGKEENDYSLQLAIWHLEDEISFSGLNETAKIYVEKATDYANNHNNFFGFDVKAMNLVYSDGRLAQSQLVGTTAVPEPSTLLLLGAGLVGLGLARRRFAKKQ